MASKIERMMDATGDEVVEDRQTFAPRAIFARDSKPDLSKMQIDQLRVAQGLTAEVTERRASIGQFVISNFPPADEVTLVPFASTSIRVYKPDPKQPPRCSAPTGVHGIGDPGILCEECAFSKWGPRNPKTGKSVPPPCKEGIAVRAYSATHKTVVDIQFMGRSASVGSFIQKQSLAFGYGNFAVKLTAKKVENSLGTWYEAAAEQLPQVPPEDVELAAKWYNAVFEAMPETAEIGLAAIGEGGNG